MTSKGYQVVPVVRVVMMMAYLSAIFLANAHPSFAASENKKSPVVVSTVSGKMEMTHIGN